MKTNECPVGARVISEECLHQGFLGLSRVTIEQPRFDGGRQTVIREVVKRRPVVVVHTFDPAKQLVLLARQFRPGAFLVGDQRPFLWEAPAGLMDEGELPLQAAARELFEETGLQAKSLELALTVYSSPGACTEMIHHLIAIVDLDEGRCWRGGVPEEHEDIELATVTLDDAVSMLRNGEIRSEHTAVGLLYLISKRASALGEGMSSEGFGSNRQD
ncbi:NUDIX domain-containing protein [Methylocaldum szegediense]|jgi:ADP-ribose pyrophosphatase|uniref:GDP-mannose pyrophosphatase n=1 Tax=Methylocaldum szegediense TaxID=73780 RepID=A0ABN8X157_9GAMM|nr:NUDIX hydrolase [Methylocaldum szegediense]CAI8808555.1 ADP-ribose pyrophosphatase [Methylocaldum szegediense]